MIYLEHDKPVTFGAKDEFGIQMDGAKLKVVELGEGLTADDCIVWDETDHNLAWSMAQMQPPGLPTPVGVLRSVERPSFESQVVAQIQHEIDKKGSGSLDDLIRSGDTWTVA